MFLTRTSCQKTTHANDYHGAWPGWAVSVSVLPLVKATVFPGIMYECESWTIKKAECQRIDAFKLWCWRRLLRVPWTARRSKQSILKEINLKYLLEGLMLKWKLRYFGHLIQRANLLEKTLMLGQDRRQEEKGTTEKMIGWHHWLNGYEFEQALGDDEGWESLACCSPWGHKESDTTEQLNNNHCAKALWSQ